MMRTILEISHEVSTIFQGFSRTNIHAVAATDTPEIVYGNPFFSIGYDINGEGADNAALSALDTVGLACDNALSS